MYKLRFAGEIADTIIDDLRSLAAQRPFIEMSATNDDVVIIMHRSHVAEVVDALSDVTFEMEPISSISGATDDLVEH